MRDIAEGAVSFGGKIGNGYGTYTASYHEIRHFRLNDAKYMEQWLNLADAPKFPKTCGDAWTYSTDKAEWRASGEGLSGVLEIPLQSEGPLLVGGGTANDEVDADICFATTAFCNYGEKRFEQRFIVPGSSLKGVLRHRVYNVCQSLELTEKDNLLRTLFGSVETGCIGRGKLSIADAELHCGNISGKDAQISVQHVALDRFTGGAIDGHLFNEAPVWGKKLQFCLWIKIENLTELEAALLGHALLDLCSGDVSVGSGGNRGNGRLRCVQPDSVRYTLRWHGQPVANNKQLSDLIATIDAAVQASCAASKGNSIC